MHARFSPAEHANFIASKVVGYATAHLDGRHDQAELSRNARSVMIELIACADDPDAKAILDPARLLTIAMLNAAAAQGEVRLDRWQHIMGALVDMVKLESHELRRTGAQRA
jgi:hypothetical protein